MKTTTFADIPVGAHFYMEMGGMRDVKCLKTSVTEMTVYRANGTGYTAISRPAWEVETAGEHLLRTQRQEEHQSQREFMERNPVPGHSNTYPYGEH